MTNEHERLPRTVELAANIVAGHVRRTETSPDMFAGLLLTAFRAVRNLERAAVDPGFLEQLIASSPMVPASDSASVSPAVSGDDLPSPEEDRRTGYVRKGRRTLHHDRLVCLEDGLEVTFLGRHLRKLGTTESDYRRRWGLPDDYPMTTQAYVDQKKAAAKRTGFGTSLRPDREARNPEETSRPPVRRVPVSTAARREGTLAPAYT